MNEQEKIKEIMAEYKEVFANGNRAVAFSSYGDYFFYQLGEKQGTYDTFVKFRTADELVSIIRTIVIECVSDNISCAADDLFFSMQEIRVKQYDLDRFCYKTELLRLLDGMEVIKRQSKILMDSFGDFCNKELNKQ